jgi:hypothetical protein
MKTEQEIREMRKNLLENFDLYEFPQTAEHSGAIKVIKWILEEDQEPEEEPSTPCIYCGLETKYSGELEAWVCCWCARIQNKKDQEPGEAEHKNPGVLVVDLTIRELLEAGIDVSLNVRKKPQEPEQCESVAGSYKCIREKGHKDDHKDSFGGNWINVPEGEVYSLMDKKAQEPEVEKEGD